ncbi:protein of unknown function [Rhizobium sp. NFR07]|uniref:DUF4304 domain-containing protein n=1 Tax=Rhizobium sp. NFR07 TaxID=1566262 RepID=UPI0008E4981D|nr:DUF4304 domain-containing protein [Rhizobium sp. NFR07]SFB17880.1 protein of unknown function [Rhizobium sp. NFR07]
MSEIAQKIDEVIKIGLIDLLRLHGFKKGGRNWHRAESDNWLIVNVQASTSNVAAGGKFTINLGVYVTAVELLAGQAAIVGKPMESQATVRERLGVLADGSDSWWTIEQSSDLNAIAADLGDKMLSLGLPWLNAHLDISRVAATLENTPSLRAVSAAFLAGDRDGAIKRLRAAADSRPSAQEHFARWAAHNGVAI